jgi:hypothetical protein
LLAVGVGELIGKILIVISFDRWPFEKSGLARRSNVRNGEPSIGVAVTQLGKMSAPAIVILGVAEPFRRAGAKVLDSGGRQCAADDPGPVFKAAHADFRARPSLDIPVTPDGESGG